MRRKFLVEAVLEGVAGGCTRRPFRASGRDVIGLDCVGRSEGPRTVAVARDVAQGWAVRGFSAQ